MIKFLDLHKQYLSIQADIDAAIAGVISDSAFVGGSAVREFEEKFAAFQNARHCVGVANGTDAIEIALEALALPAGSEVIVPANTFIASSEPVTRAGHRVVFADIDSGTYTLDPSDVERRIGPRTKAIIAVHLYGHPCDMDNLLLLAKRHNLLLIEDCAQAHGAEYRARRVGAMGDVGTFSFYPGKNLGAYGDAGAIVTDNSVLAMRCRMIANHGRIEKYNHELEGRNSRLDGLQAAILNVKLEYLNTWVDRRNYVAKRYLRNLSNISQITLPIISDVVRHAFHLFVIRTKMRDALVRHLSAQGVETGIHYPIALPKLKAYAYLGQGLEPMAANSQDVQLLSLPMGEHLQDRDIDFVTNSVRSFYETSGIPPT